MSKVGDGIHGTPEYSTTGVIPFINGNNLLEGKIIITEQTKYVNQNQQTTHDKNLNSDTILMSINGTIGNLARYNNENIMLGKSAAYIRVTTFEKDFIYFLLQTQNIYKYFMSRLTGTTIKNLGLTTIKNTPFFIPKIKEQIKIGNFFKSLDDTISLHQAAIQRQQDLKKGLLQQLFPMKNEMIPDLRFATFTEKWEQRKTKDLCSISTGKSNTQDKIDNGKYPFYVRSATIERSGKYLYDEEAVLTVGDGVGTGKVYHYVNGKYDLHQRVYRMFGFKNKVSIKYFYHYFSSYFYRRVQAMTAKTSVDSVRLEMIADMNVLFPNEIEQNKLFLLLDHLDDKIALQKQILNQLKKLKQSLLQKMFI